MAGIRLGINLILVILLLNFCGQTISEGCVPRSFGHSSVVCVCNATYCDKFPQALKVSSGQYVAYTSSKDGDRFVDEVGTLQPPGSGGARSVQVTIDPSQTYQKINGWGGAFTDSTGINIESLRDESARENLLRSYFTKEGLEYNLCRVPIGGTDFSTHGYSYNDGEEDPELKNFALALEDFDYKIPLIKKAQNLTDNNLRLLAAAWTAPTWMKHNGRYTGPDTLKVEMYQSWANYYIKFLRAYKNEGVDFWSISTGNEPSTGLLPLKINSVGWIPEHMSEFIVKNLGPTLRGSEFSNLKLITIDDQVFQFPTFIDEIFDANEEAKQYVDGFGVHWYWNFLLPTNSLTKTHNKYPDKFILSTEACSGSKPWEKAVVLGDWSRAEKYAKDIITTLENWVTGWVDWNMALDVSGGPTYIGNNVDSPIIVDAEKQEFYKQPMYYALGHFSKFLPRDSTRVNTQLSSDKNINVASFLTPNNNYVVIVLNRMQFDRVITIGTVGSTNKVQKKVPKKSITTFVFRDDTVKETMVKNL